VTYLLGGLRSLTMEGWSWSDLGQALGAIAVVAALSMALCFSALRARLRQG
jgi:ABC-type multidrug transport system permease subunit